MTGRLYNCSLSTDPVNSSRSQGYLNIITTILLHPLAFAKEKITRNQKINVSEQSRLAPSRQRSYQATTANFRSISFLNRRIYRRFLLFGNLQFPINLHLPASSASDGANSATNRYKVCVRMKMVNRHYMRHKRNFFIIHCGVEY